MVRTKIEVNISALKQRSRLMNIIIGSTTTAKDVLSKVLEKYRVREPPDNYQLWAVTKDKSKKDMLLGDAQRLSQTMSEWDKKTSVAGIQFVVRLKSSSSSANTTTTPDPLELEGAGSGLVRVYHQLYGDYESYLSYIVTPLTEASQLLEQAVAQLSSREDISHFQLVLKTGTKERMLGDAERVLALQDGFSQLELKKRKMSPSHFHSESRNPPALTSTKVTVPTDHPDPLSSGLELQRSKLNLHADLIKALGQFTSSSQMKGDMNSIKTRESVLERALVEQNQILDVMQDVIASLERENQFSMEKIEAQSKLIQESVGWESRARKAERQVRELKRSSGSLESEAASTSSSLISFEKALAQKDKLIASLQTKLNSLPSEVRRHSEGQISPTGFSSVRVQLTAERMRVIELEEELSVKKCELTKLKDELSEHHSMMLTRESEVQHLRHELEQQKKSNGQQKELLTKQRQAMMDKDVQLTSLARAYEREKKMAEQLRKRPLKSGYNDPKVADVLMSTGSTAGSGSMSMSSLKLTDLYELVSGRDIHTVTLTRPPGSSADLGFRYARTELPISSKLTCIIVKYVEWGSLAFGKLQPGDEILEVNGHACRSRDQRAAIECLEMSNGVIKIVLARDRDLSLQMQAHSTPLKKQRLSESDQTTLWATALPDLSASTMFASFSDRASSSSVARDLSKTKFVSFPTTSQTSFELPLAESIPQAPGAHISSSSPPLPTSLLKENDNRSLQRMKEMKDDEKTKEEGTIQELQTEVKGLHEQLSESERSCMELESEVDDLRSELDSLQTEVDSTKSENNKLKDKAASHSAEVADIRQNVLELQAMLVKLENQVTDDQERIASLENHNKALSNELIEAKLLSNASVKEKVEIENELFRLKQESAERIDSERKREEEFQQLLSEKDRFATELDLRSARIKELSAKVEQQTAEHQQLQEEFEQQCKELQAEMSLLKESTIKSSSSARQEQDHLQAQFMSAKNLLMEAQMKEVQQKVEMRYLKQAADEANEQLKVSEVKSRKSEEELAIYKQLVETKTLEMESLTLGLKATQHKLEAKQEMLSRLQNEVDTLRRNGARLQQEKSQTVEALNNHKSNLNATISEKERLEKKLDASVSEKDTLFQQLEESIVESTQLQQELDKLQNSLKEAEASKARGSELSAKIEELSGEKRALEEELAKQIDSFKAEKKVLESELYQSRSDSLSKSTTAQEQLSRLEAEIKGQRERLVTCEGEKAKLSHSCDNYKNREGEHLDQIEHLKTDKESLVTELKAVNDQKEDTLRNLEACQKKVESLNQQCSSFKEEKHMAEAATESLRKELKDRKSENEMLTSSREGLTEQLKAVESQLNQTRSELEQKIQEYQELSAAHSQLQEKTKIEQGHFEELKGSLTSLTDRHSKLQAEKKRSNDMVASLEFMHQQNQARLEETTNTLKLKEAEVSRLKGDVEETMADLKKERTETAHLKESLSNTKEQLERLEVRRNKEVTELKEQLSVYMKEIGELQEQVEAEKSTNAGHQSLLTQLKSNTEHANRERYIVQSSLDASLKEKAELEAMNKQLEGQLARSRSEISQLEQSGNFLSSESASLKLQLKRSSREADELTAQLQAVEMNLEVANRTLDESERERLEWSSQKENLELQFEDLKTALTQSQSSLEEMNLQLHARDEELSKMKSSLELRQRECDKLQESAIAANSSARSYKEKVGELESEKATLRAKLDQLHEEQDNVKSSLSELEKEKQEQCLRLTKENEALQNQCKELLARADSDSIRMQRLERSKKETEETVAQLLAAQEALKNSLNSLGDEKEVEILKLQSEVSKLANELEGGRKKLEESTSKCKEVEEKLRSLEQDHQTNMETCEDRQREIESLKKIAQEHKNVSEKFSGLNSKMITLQEALKTKTEHLSNLEQSLQQATSELKVLRAENERLLGKVSELASVKVSLVEKSTEMDEVKRQLASSSKKYNELTAERDHLLTMLRKLEVEKHSAAVKQATPELPRSTGVSKEELLSLLRDKEEEATKLKDYVDKLLSAVMEKAPFVLENIR